MNKTIKIILISAAVLVTAAALVITGLFISQRTTLSARYGNNLWGSQRYRDGNCSSGTCSNTPNTQSFGRGMMEGFRNDSAGRNQGQGRGMMGWGFSNGSTANETLDLDSARQAVEAYLTNLNNSDLELKEIMVFDQNAYAVVTEKSSGIGAMELLVDPASLNVFPEYGPDRMWNTKYGMMRTGGFSGARGCGMGFNWNATTSTSSEMTIDMENAASLASEYLANNVTDAQLERDGQAFYGYYTFDYTVNDKPAGMLSVNGTSGQIWLHTWHGQFIEEWGAGEAD